MRKVLQILSGLNRGGMETFIMNVYRAIDKDEMQFDFLVSKPGCDYEDEIKKLGASVFYMGSRRKDGVIGFCRNLDSFFKNHADEYIAVHYHESTLTSLEPLYYARKYGIKKRLLHAHSSSVSGSKLHYISHYTNKLLVRLLATNYIGCSQKALDWFYKGTSVMSKSLMIPNGINVNNYIYNITKRNVIRKQFGISEECLVLGHIGRFIWLKNHKFLISVFNEIHKVHHNSLLLLIGVGPLVDEIKEYVKSKGLTDSVMFLGLRSDIPDILQALDVVVMPSIYEGMPVSLIEAQASGLPVYGSDTISKDTAITSNMHFVSLKNSQLEWAQIIINGVESFERSSVSADEVKRNGFDVDGITKKLVEIYNT